MVSRKTNTTKNTKSGDQDIYIYKKRRHGRLKDIS